MNLHEALTVIAERFGFDAATLIAYAEEDTHTGWDGGAGEWACGSLWRVEGQVLYALTRALEVTKAAELGTHVGCSATHITTALQANGGGTLYAVDPWEGAGSGIPDELRPFVQQIAAHGEDWLKTRRMQFELIYEDANHSLDEVRDIWTAAIPRLRAGGLIISHDALHATAGSSVRGGIEAAGVTDALYLLIEPSDCGLALWQK